jgi:hypothetical protein
LVVFFVRMWLLYAFRRRSRPVPVRLNRFAVARLVFIFGIYISFAARHGTRFTLFHVQRRKNHDHGASLSGWLALDLADILHVAKDPLENPESEFGMGELSAPEHHGDFHLIALLQKPSDVPGLELVVVILDARSILDLLHVHRVLLLPGLSCPSLLLITELAVVHEAANRRTSVRSHLYQIQSGLRGARSRLIEGNDPHLLSIGIDESNGADPNLVINTDSLVFDRYFLQSVPAICR